MSVPKVSGIYQILCITNGKVYVGSGVNLQDRWHNHQSELRRGNHHNQMLQRAWNKYGAGAFVFSILEVAPRDKLVEREQYWIDTTGCCDRTKGYNILPKARSGLGMKMPVAAVEGLRERFSKTWKGFIDPEGNLAPPITNLSAFCREHGLSQSAMQSLAKGDPRFQSHKGWMHQNSPPRRPHRGSSKGTNAIIWEGFIDPNGNLIPPIKNLTAFCQEYGLEFANMRQVANGQRSSHKGWTHISAKENRKKHKSKHHKGFISPEGYAVEIFNLKGFCRERGLPYTQMYQLITGRCRSCQGWTYRGELEC